MSQTQKLEFAELPLVCTLTEAARPEREQHIHKLFGSSQERHELEDGYAFRFAGTDEYATQLFNFILAERSCCQFFRFELVFEPAQSAIWLHMRGPGEVKELIQGQFLLLLSLN